MGSFALIFLATFLWGIILPSYRAEMKVLVRRGRLDPIVTPTPTQSPLIEDDQSLKKNSTLKWSLCRTTTYSVQ